MNKVKIIKQLDLIFRHQQLKFFIMAGSDWGITPYTTTNDKKPRGAFLNGSTG
jgi:hypothetical protein